MRTACPDSGAGVGFVVPFGSNTHESLAIRMAGPRVCRMPQ
jgi:hypothetical protein